MKKIVPLAALIIIVVSGIFFYFQNNSKTVSLIKNSRHPSSNTQLTNELKTLLESLVKIEDASQVKNVLRSVADKSARGKTDFSLALHSAASLILENQGLLYRLRPLIEKNEVSSIAVTGLLKSFALNIPNETPWLRHILDSLFLPSSLSDFNSVKEVQNHLISNVLPKLEQLSDILSKSKGTTDELSVLHSLNLDLITGGRFQHLPTSIKKFELTNAHMALWSAKINYSIGQLHYLSSYDLEDLSEIISKIVKRRAKTSLFSDFSKKQSMAQSNLNMDRVFFEEAQKQKYKKFLTLHPWGAKHLKKAKLWIEKGLSKELWVHGITLSSLSKNNTLVIGDKELLSVLSKSQNALKEELYNLKSEADTVVIHPATGKSINLNVSSIFTPNIDSTRDLKRLFPVAYYQGKVKKSGNAEIIDLSFGTPTKWNDPTFGGLLPSGTNQNINHLTQGLLLNPGTFSVGSWVKIFL